jgi:hypothetical protein
MKVEAALASHTPEPVILGRLTCKVNYLPYLQKADEVRRAYGREIASLVEAEEAGEISADDKQDLLNGIFERFSRIMYALADGDPELTRAYAVASYVATYQQALSSGRWGILSFPWITMEDTINEIMAEQSSTDRFRLQHLRGSHQNGEVLNIPGETGSLPKGKYEVCEGRRGYYVKVPRQALLTAAHPEGTLEFEAALTGFHQKGFTRPAEFASMLSGNRLRFIWDSVNKVQLAQISVDNAPEWRDLGQTPADMEKWIKRLLHQREFFAENVKVLETWDNSLQLNLQIHIG